MPTQKAGAGFSATKTSASPRQENGEQVAALAYSPDGKNLLTGGNSGVV